MGLSVNGITIQHKYERSILGGPFESQFSVSLDNVLYDIFIEQLGVRKITIKASQDVPLDEVWDVYLKLSMLLMLFDGDFIPIDFGKVIINNNEIEEPELDKLINSRVNFYKSADFTFGNHSTFCNFENVISAEMFIAWNKILVELDIIHPMVLYSMADTGLTVDFKCALLIEVFEALSELVAIRDTTFTLPNVPKGESKLGKRLESIIDFYGADIFEREYSMNRDNFISLLVASRNRIAHIKSRQGKQVLDGPESILYAVKLSYLYRVVILSLLGIDYGLYTDKIKESVVKWNTWQGVLDQVLQKL